MADNSALAVHTVRNAITDPEGKKVGEAAGELEIGGGSGGKTS